MAHKKGVGSTKNGRDSESKRLGVKRGDGQFVRLDEQGVMPLGISGYEIGAGTKRGDGANDVLV